MSDLIVPNINCLSTEKKHNILIKIGIPPKGVLIDFRTRNFMDAITSLRARWVHARHRARNLSSPEINPKQFALLKY